MVISIIVCNFAELNTKAMKKIISVSMVQTFVKPYTIFSTQEKQTEEVEERTIEPLSPEVYYD